MKYVVTFTLIFQIYMANFGLLGSAQDFYEDYYSSAESRDFGNSDESVEEVELDDETIKKAIGSALGIALPVVLGTVGGAIVKKLVFGGPLKPHDLLKPWKLIFRGPFGIFGILGPLSPFNPNNALNPFNSITQVSNLVKGLARGQGAGVLTIGLPPAAPGVGNLPIVNPNLPIFSAPTPAGNLAIGFSKRSTDQKYSNDAANMKIYSLGLLMLFDRETLCIPKIFCTVMAEQQDDEKPKNKLEEEVKTYLDLYTGGNRKILVKRAYDNVILYASALGYLNKSPTQCSQLFSKCPSHMNDIIEAGEE